MFKVIVVGDPEVGKTSLIKRYTQAKFVKDYIPTVGVNIAKHVVTVTDSAGEEIPCNLMFWDIAGQSQFYMLHKVYFNGANGIVYAFDISRSQTFTNVKNWHKTCIKYGLSGIPAILVGNKKDLPDRKIIPPMAENLAKQLDLPFYETSALTGDNVDKIFLKITELMAENRNLL